MSDSVKVQFSFNGDEEEIVCNKNVTMIDIFEKYAKKVEQEIRNLFFVYNGDLVNSEKRLDDISGKNTEIKILVYELVNETNEEELKLSKDIICPICKEICIINFKDYKITFNNCKNKHSISEILFEEFKDFQKIIESEIICHKCNNNKNETTDNKFYKCFNCNINLCPICKLKHGKTENKKHLILDYDIKNYYCNEHGQRYILHCEECNKDYCDICENHYNHKSSFFLNI